MAGISSKSAGKLDNRKKFNAGTELNTDFDINLYETNFRSLDPQVGRFWQIDPYSDIIVELSPYNFASNNPISRNDPLGLKDSINGLKLPLKSRDPTSITFLSCISCWVNADLAKLTQFLLHIISPVFVI